MAETSRSWKEDKNKDYSAMGPGVPNLPPESITGSPADIISQFMRPNPETGYPGAFAWTGAWDKDVVPTPGPVGPGPWPDQSYMDRPLESFLLPPAAARPSATPSATVPPLSPEDQIRKLVGGYAKTAAEENEWLAERQLLGPSGPGGMTQKDVEAGRQARRGPLPWDIFTNMPEVPGKTFVGGWTDPSGKFQPLFEPKKSAGADFMGTVQPLIDEYQRRVQSSMNPPTGMGVEDVNKRTRDYYMLEAFGKHYGNIMKTLLEAGKAPSEIGKAESEIARNLSEAGRWQVAPNVYVGPGEQGTLVSQAGGPWKETARGGPETKESQAQNTLISRLIPPLAVKALEIMFDPLQPPEGRAEAQRMLAGFASMAGSQDLGTQTATGKPSKAQWLASAKKTNPGRNDQELLSYYQQKYGR